MPKRKPLTAAELKVIKKLFPNTYTQELADRFGCSYDTVARHAMAMGVKKSAAFRKQELQRQGDRLRDTGKNTRFVKGQTPANKGQKVPPHVYEKTKATMFKKGHRPHNAVEVGFEVVRYDKKNAHTFSLK